MLFKCSFLLLLAGCIFFLFNFASSRSRRLSVSCRREILVVGAACPASHGWTCISLSIWGHSRLRLPPLCPCLSPATRSHGRRYRLARSSAGCAPSRAFPLPYKGLSTRSEGAAEIHSCLVFGNTECRESSAKRMEQIAASQSFRACWTPGAASEPEASRLT